MRTLIALFLFISLSFPALATDKESAYDRVIRTGVIRCGYGLEKPYLNKDPASGEMSGIFYDYVEMLAKNLSLKVEWAEEMGWGDFPTALHSGRVDAFCMVAGKTAARAREVDYVRDILYEPAWLAVRADDTRFDGHIDLLNNPSVSFIGKEGEIEIHIIRNRFPKANVIELQQVTTNFAQAMTEVVSGKADAVLVMGSVFAAFEKANPGKLKRIEKVEPLRMISESIVVKGGEDRLRRMLDNGTLEILESGAMHDILKKNVVSDSAFFIPKPSY